MSSTLPTQVGQLARRSVVRTLRQPAQIVPSLIFPMFLLAVNSGGLKSVINLPGFPTDSYLTFALAITFMQGALFSVINSGTDLARDIETGFLNRMALTPLRGAALLSGLLAGSLMLGLMQALAYLIVGLAFGAELTAGVGGFFVIIALSVCVTVAFGTIGLFAALRTGSGEAVQGLFPVFFVFLFLSSMSLPLNLIQTYWFHTVADDQPGLLPAAGVPLAADRRLGAGQDRARLRHRLRPLRAGDARRVERPEDAAGAHVSPAASTPSAARPQAGFRTVARAVAWRSIHNFLTNKALLIPALIFPLFFFASFAGGLSAVGNVPGFDFPTGYTAFQYCFVLLQSAAFGGVFTGFGIARDFETGFGRRYLLAATDRRGIIAGYGLAALGRAFVTWAVLTAVALVGGMNIDGSGDRPGRHVHAGDPASTSPRPSGRREWRCGSARSRPAR